MFDTHLPAWDGEVCLSRFDHETEAFFVIAVHSRKRGPAAGGTRAAVYPTHADAVLDAMRLAGAMTPKMVAAGLPMGGGKSVIALPAPRHRLSDRHWRQILDVHAASLSLLNGAYWTGPDVGTTSADMDVLHAGSGFAFGRSAEAGGPGSSAPATAAGVHLAIRTAADDAGLGDLKGRRVAIQGLGAVGLDLLERILGDGAQIVATDVDAQRCERARALGAEIVAADRILSVESDVFAPCAMGGVIDRAVAATVNTAVVAGAANNVLADPEAADELARRGIVFAPDFIANGGGAVHLVGREVLGWSTSEVGEHLDHIAETLREVFDRARASDGNVDRAARAWVAEHLVDPAPAPDADRRKAAHG